MAESDMDFDGVRDRIAARRAIGAMAAVAGVLAGGGVFLAMAMGRSAPPPAAQQVAVAAAPAAVRAAPAAAPRPAAAAPAPVPLVVATTTPVVETAPSALDAFGGPLRINPARLVTPAAAPAPRLKPSDVAAFAPGVGAPSVVSLAATWLADERDRPSPFFFESDVDPRRAAPRAGFAFDGDLPAAPEEARIVLTKGETFVDALARAGVRAEDRNEAAYAFGEHYNMRRLRPGQEFVLTTAAPYQTLFQMVSAKEPTPAYLLALDFRADPETRIALSRSADGAFSAQRFATPLTTRIAAIQGRIDGSLYLSAKRQGAPDEVIGALAQMFAYDVDFQRDIFGGDEFEALFEMKFDEAGRMVGGGEILYGRLKWRSRQKEKGYYRFAAVEGGRGDYFDASGESARRLLMKTPIDGARLSSGFGTRRHPILGYQKAHKGVDFAAHRGTPIMAAGDGVVERAGPWGSFGNYVRIRHAQGYKTAYAHMNGIKKGIRSGVRVRQGDTIGTVGSTGRSTGPHLHYEVHLKDRAVNPQTLKIATGYELGGAELARFGEIRDRIDAMRLPAPAEEKSLLAGSAGNKAL